MRSLPCAAMSDDVAIEAQGLVTSRWRTSEAGRRRKYYALADAGKAALREQQEQWSVVQNALAKLWEVRYA